MATANSEYKLGCWVSGSGNELIPCFSFSFDYLSSFLSPPPFLQVVRYEACSLFAHCLRCPRRFRQPAQSPCCSSPCHRCTRPCPGPCRRRRCSPQEEAEQQEVQAKAIASQGRYSSSWQTQAAGPQTDPNPDPDPDALPCWRRRWQARWQATIHPKGHVHVHSSSCCHAPF